MVIIMDFIKTILLLFNDLFVSALKFDFIILFFTCVCVVCMVICIFQSYLKGYYHK